METYLVMKSARGFVGVVGIPYLENSSILAIQIQACTSALGEAYAYAHVDMKRTWEWPASGFDTAKHLSRASRPC